MPHLPDSAETAPSSSRELVHRINNFLTTCLAHGEHALATQSPPDMRQALGLILEGAESMSAFVRSHRPDLAVARSRSE
jgi:hypothetical protein